MKWKYLKDSGRLFADSSPRDFTPGDTSLGGLILPALDHGTTQGPRPEVAEPTSAAQSPVRVVPTLMWQQPK